jgi:hypothetical protein
MLSNIGLLKVSIALLWTDEHFELTIVIDTSSLDKSLPLVGFYFLGTKKTFQRCFKTKLDSLQSAIQLLKVI